MHIPVMLKEAIDCLDFSKDGIWIDCTLGGGGYSREIIEKLSEKNLLLGGMVEGRGGLGNILIAFDLDIKTIQNFEIELVKNSFKLYRKLNFGINQSEISIYEHINSFPWEGVSQKRNGKGFKIVLVNDNFAKVKDLIGFLKINNILDNLEIQGIVADLGLNSDQLEFESGFSFQNLEQELDMRLDNNSNVKALDILKISSVDELVKLFEKYSDLKGSYKFCKLIKENLKDNRNLNVGNLVEIINFAFGKNNAVKFNLHSKVFQALRIIVNSEYENLEQLLKDGFEILSKNGVFAIVTFHSGEDRIVKHFFKDLESRDLILFDQNITQPILPSEKEIELNNRARSAKLRFVVRK